MHFRGRAACRRAWQPMCDPQRILADVRHVLDRAPVQPEPRRRDVPADFVTAGGDGDRLDGGFRGGRFDGLRLWRCLARSGRYDQVDACLVPDGQAVRLQDLPHDLVRLAGVRLSHDHHVAGHEGIAVCKRVSGGTKLVDDIGNRAPRHGRRAACSGRHGGHREDDDEHQAA
jgi:hypothetical protein